MDGMQWYYADTGEPVDMTAPDVVAFRNGDLDLALKLLKKTNPRPDGRKNKRRHKPVWEP